MNKNNIITKALELQKIGWSIIPIGDNKKPLVNWTEFQTRKATEQEVRSWFNSWPSANIGVVTGPISNLLVLDLDAKHGRSSKEFIIPVTISSNTGGGGEHFYFKYPSFEVRNSAGALFGEGVDIRGKGGYVVLPPSIHKSGKCYEWRDFCSPFDVTLSEIPDWLETKLLQHGKNDRPKLYEKDSSEVVEGSRNEVAISVAGKILYEIPEGLKTTLGWKKMQEWNSSIPNPLPETELKSIWTSAKNYKNKSFRDLLEKKESQADQLLKMITMREDVELFKDERDSSFISLNVNGHRETWRCNSQTIKDLLSFDFYKLKGKTVGTDVIKNVISVLEGKAKFVGEKRKLGNRVALENGILWYDLTNKDWQAVKISDKKWELINNPPILFKRYTHHHPQVIPVNNGDAELILNYVNIVDEKHRLLLIVFIISCFIPDFPHPVLGISGSQGSAKSTLSKLLRKIIDPSLLEVVSLPKDQKELVQKLDHHYFTFFDNVSFISEETSDSLCKAVTGSGFSKRSLYSDDDDVIYNFMRCIGLNGISVVATRPDLLERSILVELCRIEEDKRKQEKEVYEEFDKDLPFILGGIFDTLVQALALQPSIKLSKLPRMADFMVWGCAISEALGYKKEEFIDAYNKNIEDQTRVALNDNAVALAVILFMENKNEWSGTATSLLNDLNKEDTFSERYGSGFPKAANLLTKRLNELKVNLKSIGILYESINGGDVKTITLKKFSKGVDLVSSYSPVDADDVFSKIK